MRRNRALMMYGLQQGREERPRANDGERIERMEINNYYSSNYEDRFRDGRGRDHYDDGRYAPMSYQRVYDNGYNDRYESRYDSRYDNNYNDYDGYKRVIGFGGADMRYDGPRRIDEMSNRRSDLERGHAGYDGFSKIDKHRGDEILRKLKNADGTTGEHWSLDQTKQVMDRLGISCDSVEFWVAMNMMYSDYYNAARKLGVNNSDFYASMAEAFLKDPDASENKLSRYYSIVAE